MSEAGRVSIDLEEYNEFIISKYKNGKVKTDLLDEIDKLEKTKKELIESNNNFILNKDVVMGLAFKRNKMGQDSRNEQIQIYDDSVGNYAGFKKADYLILKKLGITKEEMIAFITTQWDIKETEDKKPNPDVVEEPDDLFE